MDRAQSTVGDVSADSSAPDWSRIPFAVPCTRCRANLHGQSEPCCSRCGFRFEWGDVLPIDDLRCRRCAYQLFGLTETRCPECGDPFEWREALSEARARRSFLFEHRWRDAPLAALPRTWALAAFRPTRLWAGYSATGAVQVWPLIILLGLQWLVFAQGWHLVAMAADPVMNLVSDWLGRRIRFVYMFRPARGFLQEMAFWHLGTWLAMQAFVVSNRRHRVGWRKSLRVLVHATTFASMLSAVWCILEVVVDASILVTPRAAPIAQRLYQPLQLGVFTLGVAVTWAHLWIGYRKHLKMPHGWAMSALALLLGALLAKLVMIYL